MSKALTKRAIAVFATSLAVLLAAPSPASASTTTINGPNGNWGRVLYDSTAKQHRTIIVHDGDCNGSTHLARVDYRISGSSIIRYLWDANGCSAGDGAEFYPIGTNITTFRLCESPKNTLSPTYWCTGWVNA